jgi:hypothetical protein
MMKLCFPRFDLSFELGSVIVSNVFDYITTTALDHVNGMLKEALVCLKCMQPVLDNDLKRLGHAAFRPHVANRQGIELVAIKRSDSVLLKQDATVNIGAVNRCVWKKLSPSSQRRSRATVYTHVGWNQSVVCAQPKLKHVPGLMPNGLENRLVKDCIIVMTAVGQMSIVAFKPCNHIAQFCCTQTIYAV